MAGANSHFFWQTFPWVDPLLLCEKLIAEEANPMLFFSGKTMPEVNGGKYSFLPFHPLKTLLHRTESDYIQLLRKHLQPREVPVNAPDIFQSFCGGLCGVLSYDFGHELEDFSWNQKHNEAIPLAFFQTFETLFAFDHEQQQCFVAGWFTDEGEAKGFFQRMWSVVSPHELVNITEPQFPSLQFQPEIKKAEYIAAIEAVKEQLRAGNSYQVNFSQKWTTHSKIPPFDVFRLLAEQNPAPMMCFLQHQDFAVISCTPERLFSLRYDELFAQPIKGTRRRGASAEEDARLSEELLHDIKELAEHSMIVDLIRNDFGRVAEFGSVAVADFLRVEKYASVIHLVSDIVGKLERGKDAFHVIEAVFPGGSITGAPKVETMDILARLERSTRGVYCGSAGYVSFNGNADFNILIRTLQQSKNLLEVRAGGGIVIDSVPEREYEECLEKVMGIIGVLGEIVQ